jgi:hypothetical protein
VAAPHAPTHPAHSLQVSSRQQAPVGVRVRARQAMVAHAMAVAGARLGAVNPGSRAALASPAHKQLQVLSPQAAHSRTSALCLCQCQ